MRADVQTAGRGRLGRRWEAPAGTSLLFSLVLVPQVAPERLPSLTLVAAHAVVDALGVESAIKYPNDVLVRGRKIAGILGEARERARRARHRDQRQRPGRRPAGGHGRRRPRCSSRRAESTTAASCSPPSSQALELRYDDWLAQR